MAPGDPRSTLVSTLDKLAAETLGVAPGAWGDDVRSAFLKRLHQTRFAPSLRDHEAFEALRGRPLAPDSPLKIEANRIDEERLKNAIATFTREYFQLPPAERLERYRSLARACAEHETIRDRLRELESGLGVDLGLVQDKVHGVDELAQAIGSYYVVRHGDRKRIRPIVVDAMMTAPASQRIDWRKAVKRLQARYPAVAALAPDFLAAIRPGKAVKLRKAAQTTSPSPLQTAGSGNWAWLFAVIGMGLLRVFSMSNSSSTPRATPPTPPPSIMISAPPVSKNVIPQQLPRIAPQIPTIPGDLSYPRPILPGANSRITDPYPPRIPGGVPSPQPVVPGPNGRRASPNRPTSPLPGRGGASVPGQPSSRSFPRR